MIIAAANNFVIRVPRQRHAGPKKVDLADLHEKVFAFADWYKNWFEENFTSEKHFGADMHATLKIKPISSKSDDNT